MALGLHLLPYLPLSSVILSIILYSSASFTVLAASFHFLKGTASSFNTIIRTLHVPLPSASV